MRFDLVISGIGRDDQAENGWMLVQALRQERPSVQVVFYTGSVSPELVAGAKAAGAVGLTDDPVDLAEIVRRALTERSQ